LSKLLLSGAVFLAGTAFASPPFPPEIRTHLSLSQTPDCSLCHVNGQTGFGTVNTPFGKSMRARGLLAGSIASLDTALDALAAERTDSDGDGTPDIDELKAGTDPNVAGGGSFPPPTYGCFTITGQPRSPLGIVPVLLAALLLRMRSRRSSRSRGWR
jgi:hypothetical protein